MKKGKAFILSAPAGTGKSTLVDRLTQECPQVVRSISYTTRKPRGNEKEGEHYHFINFQQFEKKLKNGDFIEYAQVFDNYYGTDQKDCERLLNSGYDVILVIDTQGAISLKNRFDAVYVFMTPPSIEELGKRLKLRQTDAEEEIEKRLNWAHKELEQLKHYHYHIVNQDIDKSYDVLKSIILAERHKIK